MQRRERQGGQTIGGAAPFDKPAPRGARGNTGATARADAETLALSALAFLAAEETRLTRFLAESGLAPETLGAQVRDPVFLGFVLDHLLQDETLLLAFCAESGLDPERPARARARLPGASET